MDQEDFLRALKRRIRGLKAIDADKLEQARILYQNSDKSAAQVCQLFGFSRRTLFNYMTDKKQNTVRA